MQACNSSARAALRTLGRTQRSISTSAVVRQDAPRAVPKPPMVPSSHRFYKKRGFVDNDPMPERPPEGKFSITHIASVEDISSDE